MAAPVAQVFERNQDATCYVGNLDPKVDDELLWELMVREKKSKPFHHKSQQFRQIYRNFCFLNSFMILSNGLCPRFKPDRCSHYRYQKTKSPAHIKDTV